MKNTTLLAASDKPVNNWVTWFGVFFSLFSMIIIRRGFRAITPEPGTVLALTREACMFLAAGMLIWLIRCRERLPLRSIGIGKSPVGKSLAWGLVIAITCIVPAALIAKVTGYGHGAGSQAFAKLPIWVVFIVVVRAGVVEELFYRAYPIERLQGLGLGRVASWVVPLVVFSAAHLSGGRTNMVMALVLGAILTAFYQWRRDLLSNMFGHFLVDFLQTCCRLSFPDDRLPDRVGTPAGVKPRSYLCEVVRHEQI